MDHQQKNDKNKRGDRNVASNHGLLESRGGGGGGGGIEGGGGGERVTIQSQSDVGGTGDGQASQLVVTVMDPSLTPVSLE